VNNQSTVRLLINIEWLEPYQAHFSEQFEMIEMLCPDFILNCFGDLVSVFRCGMEKSTFMDEMDRIADTVMYEAGTKVHSSLSRDVTNLIYNGQYYVFMSNFLEAVYVRLSDLLCSYNYDRISFYDLKQRLQWTKYYVMELNR
jgi:hypothetical protein